MEKETYENYQLQDNLQQKQIDAQAAMYAPQVQEMASQAQAVLVTETNPYKVIRDVELSLRNLEERPDGELVSIGTPMMNHEGIKYVKLMMKGIVNQGTILSHLDEKMISKLIINLSYKIAESLAARWREYEIKISTLDDIHTVLVYASFMAIQRAYGQNEKNWLKGITVENISGRTNIPMPKKGSVWDKFKL